MHLKIENKHNQEIFVALFQLLKKSSDHISIHFEKTHLYIQSMDKSHVCLANININSNWFTLYECTTDTKISVDSNQLCSLMNYSLKHDIVEFIFDNDVNPDKLYINFLNDKNKDKIVEAKGSKEKSKDKTVKTSFDHFFELSLIDVEEDTLGIPQVDYDVECNIDAKRLVEVLNELETFGSEINIQCNENKIELSANGGPTKLNVTIPVDELNEYAIADDEEFNLSYSLMHICQMCATSKLSNTINIMLSAEYPLAFKYDLGDQSYAVFYIAPKVVD